MKELFKFQHKYFKLNEFAKGKNYLKYNSIVIKEPQVYFVKKAPLHSAHSLRVFL